MWCFSPQVIWPYTIWEPCIHLYSFPPPPPPPFFLKITRLFILKNQNMAFQTTFEYKFSQLSSVFDLLSFVLLKDSWLEVLWATEAKIKASVCFGASPDTQRQRNLHFLRTFVSGSQSLQVIQTWQIGQGRVFMRTFSLYLLLKADSLTSLQLLVSIS